MCVPQLGRFLERSEFHVIPFRQDQSKSLLVKDMGGGGPVRMFILGQRNRKSSTMRSSTSTYSPPQIIGYYII